jgi:penicillin amidase
MAKPKNSFSFSKIFYFSSLFFILFTYTLYSFFNSKVPPYSGILQVKGLVDIVEVHRDPYGVPKIFAKNEKDLYFALGYIYASERLFQIQILKRLISGRISEIIGEKGIKIDKLFRTIGLHRNSKKWLETNKSKFNQKALANTEDYLRGVNYFIKTGPTPTDSTILGMVSETVDITDIFSFVAYMAYGFAEANHTDINIGNLEKEMGLEKLNDITEDTYSFQLEEKYLSFGSEWKSIKSEILSLGLPILQGSNSWVVSSNKSTTGGALLSNDPHIAYSNPSVWYEVYLNTDQFEIYGHLMPFIPFITIGFNKNIGWGITMFENDDMDFYLEKINPQNTKQILFQGKAEDITFHNEVIKVKGAESLEIQIRETRHGVIVTDIIEELKNKEQVIAMKWSLFSEQNNPLNAFYGINHSKTIQDMSSSLSELKAPGLNFVIASKTGEIAYFAAGGLYEKNFKTDRLLDGESGKFEWGKEIPFSKNPHSINPSSGIFFTANNLHFGKLDYNLSGYWQADDRSNQIAKFFRTKNKYSVDDLKNLILDDYIDSSDYILELLFQEVKESGLNDIELKSLEILKDWNRKSDVNSIGASIFSELRYYLVRNIFLDELGEKRFEEICSTSRIHHYLRRIFKKKNSDWWDNKLTIEKEDYKLILKKSFQDSIYSLVGKLGKNPYEWQWGKLHTLTLNHPLGSVPLLGKLFNSGPRKISGATETVNNQLTLLKSNSHEVEAGPSMRMILDMSKLEEVYIINPLGQSGHRLSPHFDDQVELFTNGKFRKFNFYEMKETDSNRILSLMPD